MFANKYHDKQISYGMAVNFSAGNAQATQVAINIDLLRRLCRHRHNGRVYSSY